MSFTKNNIPWNKGIKGYKRDKYNSSYYQRNRELIIANATLNKRSNKEFLAGRAKPDICEVCGQKDRICFDHDHITGEFRGWLCFKCNTTLGYARDNPAILHALEMYLVMHHVKSEIKKLTQ